jgi:hypothetical protein
VADGRHDSVPGTGHDPGSDYHTVADPGSDRDPSDPFSDSDRTGGGRIDFYDRTTS